MARRSDHTRDELREMILEAARNIVETDGYQALTVRAVTSRIGYTAGTLYQIFDNLEALFAAVNAETVAELGDSIVAQTGAIEDPKTRLREMSHRYLVFAFSHPDRWRLAFEQLYPSGRDRPESIMRETGAMFDCVNRLLRQAAPELPVKRLRTGAAAFWAGVHGVCHLALSQRLDLATSQPVEVVLDELIDTFFAGIAEP